MSRVIEILERYNIEHKLEGNSEVLFLCPFHDDHSLGSAKFNLVEEIYHCFSCGAKGNIYTFVANIENCSLAQAEQIINGSTITAEQIKNKKFGVQGYQYQKMVAYLTKSILTKLSELKEKINASSLVKWISIINSLQSIPLDDLDNEYKKLILIYKIFLTELKTME